MAMSDFSNPDSKVSLKIKEDRFQKFRKMGDFAFAPLSLGTQP
jgi:hypothetical protein